MALTDQGLACKSHGLRCVISDLENSLLLEAILMTAFREAWGFLELAQ
jgi:hypothetical protein